MIDLDDLKYGHCDCAPGNEFGLDEQVCAEHEDESNWCPICDQRADLPVHDWECFK